MDPDLEQLRKKARELQRAVRSGDPDALALVAEFHPDGPPNATFQLSAAQLVLARKYGFASWPRLRRHVEIVTSSTWQPARPAPGADLAAAFLRLSCGGYPLTDGEDPAATWVLRPRIWRDLHGARDLLAQHPELPATSLAVAAACADVDAVRRHLANDPSLATRGSEPYGWPPLLYQAYARHDPRVGTDATLQTARLLLAAGADPNEGRFWHGLPNPRTVLSGALESRDGDEAQHARALAFARLLLEAGADPDDGSVTLLERDERDDFLELLFEFGLGPDTNGPWRRLLGDQLASTASVLRLLLYFAIEGDHRARVALLARHGVDLASPFTDLSNWFESPHRWPAATPAAVALVNGDRQLARQLADLGAPLPEPASPDGFVAAVLAGDAAAVRSADPAAVAAVRSLWPGLPVWAASRGVLESVPLLVEAGFDVNAFGRSDGPYHQPRWHSALHVAADKGDLALAQRLLDIGADPNIRRPSRGSYAGSSWELELPDEHATPLDWARRSGHQALTDLLEPRTQT
jgi:ankyrin repeat protein